ncbi:glycosyltransferase family 39 protein [bacterium]|nr:MAG: glycosyltransferase family 39 protein [bacterium]
MTARRVKPPFSWLGPFTDSLVLASALLLAIFMRFYDLAQLPPGFDASLATSAIQAQALLQHGTIPGLDSSNGYAPLWVWLQAIGIKIAGASPLSLRLLPAALGALAVIPMWFVTRQWLGRTAAHAATFTLASLPWAVTASRLGTVAAAVPLMLTLTVWLAGRAWRQPQPIRAGLLAVVALVNLAIGPLGWLINALVLGLAFVRIIHRHKRPTTTPSVVTGVVFSGLVMATIIVMVANSWDSLSQLFNWSGFSYKPASWLAALSANFLMLIGPGSGDANYVHNLPDQPALNSFLAISFATGLLVAITRIKFYTYRWLLAWLFIGLLPAVFTAPGTANFSRAVVALPAVVMLAGLGIHYILNLWYSTFPANSAARSVGQATVIVLIILSTALGYTQYFRAWGHTGATYAAHNEGAVRLGTNLHTSKQDGSVYVVTTPAEQPIIQYLADSRPATYIKIDELALLPTAGEAKYFYISASERDASKKLLKAKFPGGTFKPHFSPFNQTEVYYTYEMTK